MSAQTSMQCDSRHCPTCGRLCRTSSLAHGMNCFGLLRDLNLQVRNYKHVFNHGTTSSKHDFEFSAHMGVCARGRDGCCSPNSTVRSPAHAALGFAVGTCQGAGTTYNIKSETKQHWLSSTPATSTAGPSTRRCQSSATARTLAQQPQLQSHRLGRVLLDNCTVLRSRSQRHGQGPRLHDIQPPGLISPAKGY